MWPRKNIARWLVLIFALGGAFIVDDILYFLLADNLLVLELQAPLRLLIYFLIFALNGVLTVVVVRDLVKRPRMGREGLCGQIGRALTAINREAGKVWVHGERWRARSEVPIAKGAAVVVESIESGLTLHVSPQASNPAAAD